MRKWLFLSVVTEVLAKLALYGSVLTLFVGATTVATTRTAGMIAIFAAALGFARTWLRGQLLAKQIQSLYRALAAAARRKTVPGLVANQDGQQPADLVHCVSEVATVQALSVPDLIASFIGLAILLALTAARLGFALLALGVVSAAALVALLSPIRKLARSARAAAWDGTIHSTKTFTTLLRGSFEVRGAGLERQVERLFLEQGDGVARGERRGMLLGGVSGILPAVLGLVLLGFPRDWVEPFLGTRLGEVGVLGAAGVALALSATGALDAVTRNGPLRADLGRFFETKLGWLIDLDVQIVSPAAAGDTRIRSLSFHDVSVRYEGARVSTPNALSFELSRGGVALLGPNGAGKTSALYAALGLVETSGEVRVNEKKPDSDDWLALHRRCWVVPQRPHVVPDETIRFHMSAFGCEEITEEDLDRAVEMVGLRERLDARAARAKVPIGDLSFGALSGGEQRRILLAAASLRDADLLLFDEPESSLDEGGRHELRGLFERLAKDRLVLLAAHDASVIPDHFARVVVDRGD